MAHLFIPGPTDVDPGVLAAQAQPMIGHRSEACYALIGRIQPKLCQVFQTNGRVYITTSSGTGLQEAAVRNCVGERLLVAVCGAFGERFYQVAQANGVAADRVDAEWGQPNLPAEVAAALSRHSYDALAIVHNETSTGVENPVREIASRARDIDDGMLILVDAVSSAAGANIETDEWGLDVVLTSSQKCFALPPGLAFASVSDRALERARSIEHHGWYFDFLNLEKYLARHATPATPAISLLYALDRQLDRIIAEGLSARFERHARMAAKVQEWGERTFELFAAPGFRSQTVTAIQNTLGVDVRMLNQFLGERDMVISNGYGPLKDRTFRIAHMGETHPEDIAALLSLIDEFLSASDHQLERGY
jgi:predicted phosphoserine aminotransferase